MKQAGEEQSLELSLHPIRAERPPQTVEEFVDFTASLRTSCAILKIMHLPRKLSWDLTRSHAVIKLHDGKWWYQMRREQPRLALSADGKNELIETLQTAALLQVLVLQKAIVMK